MEQRARAEQSPRSIAWGDRIVIAACALAVYLATLAPSIGPGDSPELTAALWTLGVTHPTGYPFYTLLGFAFSHAFPLGSVAFRLNLLSALAMTGGLLLLHTVARQLGARRLPALAATLLLAVSPTLWSQALITEVYALHVLLLAAVLAAGLAWDRSGALRWLRLTLLLYGLALTHHLMSTLLAPGLLYLALTSRHRGMLWKHGLGLLVCLLAPLLLYLHLPLAAWADRPVNWGDTRTWSNFVFHVTGRQYRGLMFTLGRGELWQRVQWYGGYLPGQFGVVGTVLGLLGIWRLARQERRWLWGTALLYAVNIVYALNYKVFDVEVYYIPSSCVYALWIAQGFGWVMGWSRVVLGRRKWATRREVRGVAWGACAVLPAMLAWGHWAEVSQHDNWEMLEYGRGYLATLPRNAVLLAGGDDIYFPLLYTKYVEGRRPDVLLLSYFDAMFPGRERLFERLASQDLRVRPITCRAQHPVGGQPHFCYLRGLLAENIDRRPVYMISPTYAMKWPGLLRTLAPYRRVQMTNLPGWRLYRVPPPLEPGGQPAHAASITFGKIARFAGYDAQPIERDGASLLHVRYYWDLLRPLPKEGLKAWVMFTDAQGNYNRNRDGGPCFQNIHLLGQGRPLAHAGFPRRICETLDLVVPHEEANQERRLRVALSLGERFFPPIESPRERFADAGSIGTRELAADSSPAGEPERPGANPRALVPAAIRRGACSL